MNTIKNLRSIIAGTLLTGAALTTPTVVEAQQQCNVQNQTTFAPVIVRENEQGVQDNQTPIRYTQRGDTLVAVVPYNPFLNKSLRVTGQPANIYASSHPFFDGNARREGRVDYQRELQGKRHVVNHEIHANCEIRPAKTIFVPIHPSNSRTEAPVYNAAQRDSVLLGNITDLHADVTNLDRRVINLETLYDSLRATTTVTRGTTGSQTQTQSPRTPPRHLQSNNERGTSTEQARSQVTIGGGYFVQLSESEVPRGTFTMNLSGPSAYALIVRQPGANGVLLAARSMLVNASGDHGDQGGLRERTALTTNYLEAEGVLAKKMHNYLLGGRATFQGVTTTEFPSPTNTTVQGRARSTNGQLTTQFAGGYDRNGVRAIAAIGPRIRDDAQPGTNPQMVYTAELAREGLGALDARAKFEHVQNGDATVTGMTGNLVYRMPNGLGIGAQVTRSNQRTLTETTNNTLFGIYGTYTLGGKK